MGDFNIISEVSNAIIKTMRDNICPELIQSPESIALTIPSDKNADFQVGLYLYDIQEMREYRQTEYVRINHLQRRLPPKPLNLYYALYVNSKSQLTVDAENEQRILGRAMQILMDYPVLPEDIGDDEGMGATVTLQTMSFEEKSKLWSVLSVPYQLAVYFSVSPVLLSSRKVSSFTRVVDARFGMEQMEGGRG
ncbi:MAG: DUF4255 domain-containing protein [Kineothrix sp.]